MSTYLRLLGYIKKYRGRFILGIFFALCLSLFNGLGMAALKPIFDIFGADKHKPFQLYFNAEELTDLHNAGLSEKVEKLFQQHPLYEPQRKLLADIMKAPKIEKSGLVNFITVTRLKWTLELNEWLIHIAPLTVLIWVCLGVLPIYLLRLASMLGAVYFIVSAGLAAVKDIRAALYSNLIYLPMGHFVREKTGVWMSRIINDATIVSDSISSELKVSIVNFFIIFTHLIFLALISYKLLLICFIGVPLVLWPVTALAKKIKNISTGEQEYLAQLNGHLQEVISGIRVIRAFGMETFEKKKFDEINYNLFTKNLKYRVNHTLGPSLVEMITSMIVIGLLLYGGMTIFDQQLSTGSFFTFLFTLLVILSPIKQMTSWYNLTQRTIAAGERIFEVMDLESDIKDPENPVEIKKVAVGVTINNVSFTYPETSEKVLENIHIHAKVGSTIALVGHSGAGKSTLADLLGRFYDPQQGSVEIDGVDIRNFRLHDLRSKIGIVTQDVFLFNGTIRENICYGRTDVSDEQLHNAAKMAFADIFIQELPQGYDTFIGERGLLLSGGQRQRISIARALLKNPEILILDEATSALDTQSEQLVQQALDSLMQNRTTFVIAHRLSTIFKADEIVVLQRGKIIERGTHEQLLNQRGHYNDLYTLQFQKADAK